MSRHVSQNAEVAVVTGGQCQGGGRQSHMTQHQALEQDATQPPLTTDLPDGGWKIHRGKGICVSKKPTGNDVYAL